MSFQDEFPNPPSARKVSKMKAFPEEEDEEAKEEDETASNAPSEGKCTIKPFNAQDDTGVPFH